MISSFYNSIELYSYSSIIYFSAPTKISHIHCKQILCQRLLKLLASNAILRKIAYLAEIPFPEFLLNACW